MKFSLGQIQFQAFLDGASPELDGMVIWWLGQAGFALQSGSSRILLDPYLSDSLARKYKNREFKHIRMMPPPCQPEDFSKLDAVLCTHAHSDHMDPGTLPAIVAKLPECRFIFPRSEVEKAQDAGIPPERSVGLDVGETVRIGDFKFEAVPAAHQELTRNQAGEFRHLGYIISGGGVKIYHSGDCVPFPGQTELLRNRQIDVALLPVNGRDEYRASRGVPGNFTFAEAVALCSGAGIEYMLSHHWGMFDFNTIPEAELEQLIAATTIVRCIKPELAKPYIISI